VVTQAPTKKIKIVALVQARMGSTRLPDKTMLPIEGVPMISLLMKRLALSKHIDEIVLATSDAPKNDVLVAEVAKSGFRSFRGSEDDVLNRIYKAAEEAQADAVVRITGDCPLIDPQLVDEVIDLFLASGCDYASNVQPPTYPDGLDTEIFRFDALKKSALQASLPRHRQSPTLHIRQTEGFSRKNKSAVSDLSALRWTVDEAEDYEIIKKIFGHFYPRIDFSWTEVLEFQKNNPALFGSNAHLKRNEGLQMSNGQKLWKRAKKVIPGGNMLLSKKAERFLPNKWPAYFSKAKGCRVWDLDGNEYIDMCYMGIGTNTLGYGNPEVDQAVREVVDFGNLSTLNCPEEVYLAERLVELHPWAHMVRLARTGGEANAIAIRIARAASGRDKVAICGYHGWHDWYLAANLGNKQNLKGHLMAGLEPGGVPEHLKDTIYPFRYSQISELKDIVKNHEIGVIKMEVARTTEPDIPFLKQVREIADKNGIVLIFDECTSGFRQAFGGLHKICGVEPDMAVFGKTLGNGYAITAAIGKREVMEAAQATFISSTFWTERIGPTAALKTLEVMQREKSWETITATGRSIAQKWKALAEKHSLKLDLNGLPALIGFSFPSENMLKYKTFITQEMLKKGFLAANSIYACTVHTAELIDRYMNELDPLFAVIRECENGRSIDDLLEGPVCETGFSRLN